MTPDVVVVGGGAAGLMAATVAAHRGKQVLLIEKMDQAGRKLRITGKGRCNLTNTSPLRETLTHIGPDARFLRNAYGRFFNQELMRFFEERGVALVEERGGRVFPSSGKSLDVFLALMHELESCSNVEIRKGRMVKQVEVFREGATAQATAVILQGGERIACRHIVLATGGLSYPTTGSTGAGFRIARELGHTVVEPVPALVALRCKEALTEDMNGFVLRNVSLSVAVEGKRVYQSATGEMAFCRDGLTGPLVLSASRYASRPLHEGKPVEVHLDLKPGLTAEQLDKRLQADLAQNGTRVFNDALRMWLPAELVPFALTQLHIEYYKRLHQINGEERRRLGRWLKDVAFTMTGTHDWTEAIITQGGVEVGEVNPKTMESRLVSGLYIVGELLNLDADTGGYNLQIAFSTGHAAGEAV